MSAIKITECPHCHESVSSLAVFNILPVNMQARDLMYNCPKCGSKGKVRISMQEYQNMIRTVNEETATEDSTAIGEIVASFRLDMELVDTIEDLAPYWALDAPRWRACGCPQCAADRNMFGAPYNRVHD